ncbi:MAG: IS1634 family transposase [Candidatus Altiarchaeota archaeon]|nr:IS1634 family transposase [Candidatus Altiarchaeota archaeon]
MNGSIKALRAGGTELTRRMDRKTGLSDVINSMNLKQRGVPLDKIALSLVSARIDQPKSVFQSVRDIRDRSSALLEFGIDPKDVHVKTYYRGLEKLGEHGEDIYSKLMDAVDEEFGLDLSVVFADWTSSFFHGNKCTIAKYGHSKDKRSDKKQIKIGLAMNDKQNIPFYYSVEDGNVVDMDQFKKDFEGFSHRLPEGSLIVFDKGPKSEKNCDLVTDKHCHYLTAVKDYKYVRKKMQSIDKTQMQHVMTYKTGENVHVHVEKTNGIYRYFYHDERRAKHDDKKRNKKIKKTLTEKKEMMDTLKEKGVKALKKKLTKKKEITKQLNDVVVTTKITIQKRLWKKTDEEIIADLEKDKDLDGFYALDSSKELDPKDALQLYRRKDKVEKLISDLKSVCQIRPFRVRRENAVKGAVLICMITALFIALAQQTSGLVKKAKKTIVDALKGLTLIVEVDDYGNILGRKYANVTSFLAKLLGLSLG